MIAPSVRGFVGASVHAMLAAMVVMLGCSVESELVSRRFLSERVIEDGEPRELVGATRLSLSFGEEPSLGEKPSFGADAGCNGLGGKYDLRGDGFVTLELGSTLALCEGDLADQEEWYFSFLGSRPTLELDGSSLVLEGGGTRIEYLEDRVATPDLELVGPTWTVTATVDRGVATRVEPSSPATLVFDEDGTVAVDTGCNTGSGTYDATVGLVTIRDLGLTEAACEGPAATLEDAMLDVIADDDAISFRIRIDRLALHQGDLGLDLVGTEG